MITLAKNELNALKFLTRHFTESYSINQLAKQIGLTPKGMHKLLKRLERQNIVKPLKMGNSVFYKVNFEYDLARKAAEISLFDEIKLPYAKVQAKDLLVLRPVTLAVILFGSLLEKGEKAGDIDILAVLKQEQYRAFKKSLDNLQLIKPKHIQPVVQSPQDLVNNLKKKDAVLLEVLKKGRILWGHEIILAA